MQNDTEKAKVRYNVQKLKNVEIERKYVKKILDLKSVKSLMI